MKFPQNNLFYFTQEVRMEKKYIKEIIPQE